MALPETNPQASGSAPKMDGASRSTRPTPQIRRPSSRDHRQEQNDGSFGATLPNPIQALQQSRDPRQAVADLADKYLNLGSEVGMLLFVIWGVLSFGTLPAVILGVGLIPGVIFNILLFSPKTVYRITEFILDFIPAADVAVEAVDELGLGKVDIKIKDWQKGLILAYDAIAAIIIILFVSTVLISLCTISSGTVTNVAGKVSDALSGTNTYASLNAFCSTLIH